MTRRLAILLPALWIANGMLSYQHPGDEYGLLGVTLLPGLWAVLLLPMNVSHVSDILPLSLGIGGVVMGGFGWLHDWLQTRRRWFFGGWLLCAVIALSVTLNAYPNLDAAVAKNGSLLAYLFVSISLGLYGAVLFVTPAMVFYHVFRRRPKPGECPQCFYDMSGNVGGRCPECGHTPPASD